MFDFEYKSSNAFIPLVVAFNAKLDSKADEAELDVTNENVDVLSGTVATQGEAIAENAAAILDETEAREAAVEELNEKISEIPKFKFEVVDTLPETGDSATIYLVRDESGEGTNTYKEYVYSNGQWEEIGPVIDLSPYATKEEVEAVVESLREADAALDEKIANEIAARENAIAVETAARENAIAIETSARESAAAELNTAISNEVSAREEAVSGEAAERQRVDEWLHGQITQEASAREAADDVLNDAISDEVEARVAADIQLNTAISNEVTARQEAVANEASARESADAELNTAISNEATAREAADAELNEAIANEVAAREEAVANLNEALNNEVSIRESADTELNAAIAGEVAAREEAVANEASVRESADVELNEAIANEISAREAAIVQEIADRIAADNGLNTAIVNETEARVANYNDLVTSIANETAVRIAADNDLSATITNEIASERSARESAVSNEASARQAADAELNTAVSNEAAAREEAVSNEASEREAADTELNTAISNEIAAREEAVANEASAREVADTGLNTAIANEAAAREEGVSSAFTAIEKVAEDLEDEVNAREQAIFELHEEIVALPKFKITIVDELPVSGDNATIYLVPAGSESGNIYTEYVYVNDAWEEVGPEKLDLSEYAKIEDVDDALALKADAADVYTKDEADAKFLTEHQDISGLATKEELSAATEPLAVKDDVDAALALKANAADVAESLALKANSADVYTKDEADAKFLTEHQDISGLATKEELSAATEPLAVAADVDAALALKANVADVYAKADVDSALAEKVSVADFETLSGIVEDIVLENESIEEKLIGLAEANLAQDEVIATKANADDVYAKADVYTKAEVDELVAPKADKSYVDSEIYKLTTIVGNMGGAVTYELPSPAGKSFNTLMSNNGTVKLTDDVESGRFGPGITAKNTTKLNLNGHDLTITGLTTSSTQPAIMSRGTENLTIYGKGTIDAGGGVCIEANGVDSVINLTGSTTVYRTNRSGGELIYCYAGTINITNGTFRNDGENTAYLLNCYDANYKADPKKANIIVSSTSKTSGPKFYDFNPADNSAEGEHTNFVAAGCEVVVSTVVEGEVEHTVYTVVKSAE